jgi:hypothetical protein
VVIGSYPTEDAYRRHLADAHAHPVVRDEILPTATTRVLRLAPTGRSLLS